MTPVPHVARPAGDVFEPQWLGPDRDGCWIRAADAPAITRASLADGRLHGVQGCEVAQQVVSYGGAAWLCRYGAELLRHDASGQSRPVPVVATHLTCSPGCGLWARTDDRRLARVSEEGQIAVEVPAPTAGLVLAGERRVWSVESGEGDVVALRAYDGGTGTAAGIVDNLPSPRMIGAAHGAMWVIVTEAPGVADGRRLVGIDELTLEIVSDVSFAVSAQLCVAKGLVWTIPQDGRRGEMRALTGHDPFTGELERQKPMPAWLSWHAPAGDHLWAHDFHEAVYAIPFADGDAIRFNCRALDVRAYRRPDPPTLDAEQVERALVDKIRADVAAAQAWAATHPSPDEPAWTIDDVHLVESFPDTTLVVLYHFDDRRDQQFGFHERVWEANGAFRGDWLELRRLWDFDLPGSEITRATADRDDDIIWT